MATATLFYQSKKEGHGQPTGPVERAWRWCRRRPAWAALIGTCVLGLLTLLGGGVWFTRQLGQELQRIEQARRETAAAERRLQFAFTHEVADGLDSDLRQLAAVRRTMTLLLGERADWSEEQLAAGMRDARASEPRLFGGRLGSSSRRLGRVQSGWSVQPVLACAATQQRERNVERRIRRVDSPYEDAPYPVLGYRTVPGGALGRWELRVRQQPGSTRVA